MTGSPYVRLGLSMTVTVAPRRVVCRVPSMGLAELRLEFRADPQEWHADEQDAHLPFGKLPGRTPDGVRRPRCLVGLRLTSTGTMTSRINTKQSKSLPFSETSARVPADRLAMSNRDSVSSSKATNGAYRAGQVLAGSVLVAAGGSALSATGTCGFLGSDRAPTGREGT